MHLVLGYSHVEISERCNLLIPVVAIHPRYPANCWTVMSIPEEYRKNTRYRHSDAGTLGLPNVLRLASSYSGVASSRVLLDFRAYDNTVHDKPINEGTSLRLFRS